MLLAIAPIAAQCAPAWQPGAPTSGPSGNVAALVCAANGDLYAGGQFDVADSTFVHNVARWDGSTWHALGTGTDGWIGALAARPNGNIVAGGLFFTAGGVPANSLAEWNGAQWSPLGAGITIGGYVDALLVLPNGDLIAGGSFASAGGGAAANVARWSNGVWSALGAGFAGTVRCLAMMPNGDIVAGGTAGSTGGPILQRWDGSGWTTLAAPMQEVFALAVAPNGALFVGGHGANFLVSWNGLVFQPVPVTMWVWALSIDATTGDLFIGGSGSWPTMNVARWDGATLTDLSSSPTTSLVYALAQLANGELVTGGSRNSLLEPNTVRRLSGSTWSTVGAPASALDVQAFTQLATGDMVVGGRFQGLEGTPLSNIGRWDGAHWQPLGVGVDDQVAAVAVAANGDLIAGGSFTHAGGAPAQYIARWNGATWSALGVGPPSPVLALTTRSSGDIIAVSGAGGLMRWNGSAWALLIGGNYTALATLPNDDVVFAGIGGVAIWNGSTFAPLGTQPGFGRCVLVRRNGDLILGGDNLSVPGGGIARWNGTAWVSLGAGINGAVCGLAELPNGDLVAAAGLINPIAPPFAGLMRWDGSTWSTIDGTDGIVFDVACNDRGELFAGGVFARVGNVVAANLARSTPPCPASATAYGIGCTGSAGPVALTASSLPWAGATFRGRALGMTPLSLAVHVVGTAPTAQPLPLGAPGCDLLVAPILTGVLFPNGGEVATPLTIPNAASLVGAQVRTQVVGLELTSGLALLRTTGSNALLLTIGAL